MKWIKNWSYIILLIGTGVMYLACVDNWQVYAKPFEQIRSWYKDAGPGNLSAAGGTGGQAAAGGPAGGDGTESLPAEENPANVFETGGSRQEGGDSGSNERGGPDGDLGEEPSVVSEEGSESSGGRGGTSVPSGTEGGAGSGEAGGDSAASEEPSGGLPDGEVAGGGSGSNEPVYMTVEDDYFSDAVFIGDSRTVGMFEYGGLEETAAFYASTGLTVYKMFDSAIVSVPGQKKKITVEEALQQNSFAKIYLMIGINEMGTGTVDSFIEAYSGAVAHLQELQPDAVIYLQGIIRVTAERSAQGDYINNEGIDARNEGIAKLADNEKIFYLDVNPLICDETGGMIADYTFDGVHLKAKYIEIWKDYLKSHAIFP